MGLLAEDKFSEIRDHIKEDGSLQSYRHYIDWKPGDSTITLDGEYPIETVRQIVDWISFIESSNKGDKK